jgi:hypothetical protein
MLLRARVELAKRYSPSTVNSVLGSVKAVLRQGLRLGVIPPETYLDVISVHGMDRDQPTPPLQLSANDLALLFDACEEDESSAGRRDAFIIMLIACAGFDRREVARLGAVQGLRPADTGYHVAVFTQPTGSCSLLVQEHARQVISKWLHARGFAPGPAICKFSKRGDVIAAEPISEQQVYFILRKRAQEAGIGPVAVTALKWYYRQNLPEMTPGQTPAHSRARIVIEPPLPLTAHQKAARAHTGHRRAKRPKR